MDYCRNCILSHLKPTRLSTFRSRIAPWEEFFHDNIPWSFIEFGKPYVLHIIREVLILLKAISLSHTFLSHLIISARILYCIHLKKTTQVIFSFERRFESKFSFNILNENKQGGKKMTTPFLKGDLYMGKVALEDRQSLLVWFFFFKVKAVSFLRPNWKFK